MTRIETFVFILTLPLAYCFHIDDFCNEQLSNDTFYCHPRRPDAYIQCAPKCAGGTRMGHLIRCGPNESFSTIVKACVCVFLSDCAEKKTMPNPTDKESRRAWKICRAHRRTTDPVEFLPDRLDTSAFFICPLNAALARKYTCPPRHCYNETTNACERTRDGHQLAAANLIVGSTDAAATQFDDATEAPAAATHSDDATEAPTVATQSDDATEAPTAATQSDDATEAPVASDATSNADTDSTSGDSTTGDTTADDDIAKADMIVATTSPEDAASPEDATASPEDATASPEDAIASPEDATASPEDATASPEDNANPEDDAANITQDDGSSTSDPTTGISIPPVPTAEDDDGATPTETTAEDDATPTETTAEDDDGATATDTNTTATNTTTTDEEGEMEEINCPPAPAVPSGPCKPAPAATRTRATSPAICRPRYLYHPEKADWEGARLLCEREGGQLAIITSERAQGTIQNRFTYQKEFWIGATDLEREGQFRWVNGEPMGFARWASGQPKASYPNNQHCVTFNYGKGKWADRNCYESLPFLCETMVCKPSTNYYPSGYPNAFQGPLKYPYLFPRNQNFPGARSWQGIATQNLPYGRGFPYNVHPQFRPGYGRK